MKKRLFLAGLCLLLLFAPDVRVFAADSEDPASNQPLLMDEAELSVHLTEQESDEEAPETQLEQAAEPVKPEGPDILLDGVSVREQSAARVCGQTTYLSLRAMVSAMYPDAQISWTSEGAVAQADGLHITAKPGSTYLVANGRYLYVPDGIMLDSGVTLVPVRVLAKALGASVSWDAATGTIGIASGKAPIEDADSFYRSDAVYWLSRIICAESGTQPLAGKIAVGTVILNRVGSPLFPDTIYDVIFQRLGGSYQFSPVRSGAIYQEPNAESVIAAKLCLDGAREAGNSLFFNAAGQTCWASRNRMLVVTIGGHSFYE